MKNEYQEKAIRTSFDDTKKGGCMTCGKTCPYCEGSGKEDENFHEVENRSTSELMEKGNMKKEGHFEER